MPDKATAIIDEKCLPTVVNKQYQLRSATDSVLTRRVYQTLTTSIDSGEGEGSPAG